MPLEILFNLLELVFGAAGRGIGSAIDRSQREAALSRSRGEQLDEIRKQIVACPLVPIAGAGGPAALEGVARPLTTVEASPTGSQSARSRLAWRWGIARPPGGSSSPLRRAAS